MVSITNFEKELQLLINRHSLENASDTPDFVLARYLRVCLENWSTCIKDRDSWYGSKSVEFALKSKTPIEPDAATQD